MKKSTAKNTGNRGKLKPPWPPGHSGNPKGRPKGTVRQWSAVMREFFRLMEANPAELERLTGMKLPANLEGKDGQLLLIFNQFIRGMKGDSSAVEKIFDRMDGKPKESLTVDQKPGVDLLALPPDLREEVAREIIENAKKEKRNKK